MMLKDFSNYPSSNTVRYIPRSHWTKHLHNFENPKEGLVKGVTKFISEWKEHTIPAPHLILTGKAGRGKTHIAVGIYRHGVYVSDTVECAYVYVPDFCNAVKRGYGTGDDPFEDIEPASLVVLDDIFGSDLSEHEISKILARLITTAYNKNQALVVTSNYTINEIQSILHPHEKSRLFQNAIKINMTLDKDYRL